jgi:hypothetical protein
MTSIFSLDKWFEIIERGTSGDQVHDILYSWKSERDNNSALNEVIEQRKFQSKEIDNLLRTQNRLVAEIETLHNRINELVQQADTTYEPYRLMVLDFETLEKSEEMSKWIPASTPPTEEGHYIVYAAPKLEHNFGDWETRNVYECVYSKVGWHTANNVIEWMPLPEPPEGER